LARCHRGKIPKNVERDLWGRSGGYCCNPDCRANLIIETASGKAISIGELAHLVAWSPTGPRRDALDQKLSCSVDSVENLVLLCPTCHAIADAAPLDFPVEQLVEWREKRTSRVRQVAAVPRFELREEVVEEIGRLLTINRTIHQTYGPESTAAENPISTAVKTWRREVVRVVLPNNRRICELAEANNGLLGVEDREAVAEFTVHSDAFSYNQLSGARDENAPTFPAAMSDRFES
jgi:hypothetical protein